MSEQLRESLSALMDSQASELELQRLLKQVGKDGELRDTWVRYQAVRTVLSGQSAGDLRMDISSRVSAAIAAESAPAATSARARLLRPLASFAVAASVAAVVVLGGQQLAQVADPADPYGAGQASIAGASPVGLVNSLGAVPVQASYGAEPVPVLEPAARTAYKELARQRMQMYMQEHAEHAALNTPQGMMPFARVQEIRQ